MSGEFMGSEEYPGFEDVAPHYDGDDHRDSGTFGGGMDMDPHTDGFPDSGIIPAGELSAHSVPYDEAAVDAPPAMEPADVAEHVEAPIRPVVDRWVGVRARSMSREDLQAAAEFRDTVMKASERQEFPRGLPLTSERVRAVQDLGTAAIEYVSEKLGIDISDRRITATPENTSFFADAEFEATRQHPRGPGKGGEGFTTPLNSFIGVHEVGDEGHTLHIAQHELLHAMGVEQDTIVQAEGTDELIVAPWRRGLEVNGRFGLLDEAVVVHMTDEVQAHGWLRHESTVAYASTVPPVIAEVKKTPEGHYNLNVVSRSLLNAMCERASDIVGEDVRVQLERSHFTGDNQGLLLLGEAFGKKAVAILSQLGSSGITRKDILVVAEEMRIKKEFFAQLRSYKG